MKVTNFKPKIVLLDVELQIVEEKFEVEVQEFKENVKDEDINEEYTDVTFDGLLEETVDECSITASICE